MTCLEFKELAPSFGLGALDEEAAIACQDHLGSQSVHDGCEAALKQADSAAALLSAELPAVAPGEAVWDRIEGDLRRQASVALRQAPPPPRWWRATGAVAAAASVAAVALLWGHNRSLEVQTAVARAQANQVSIATAEATAEAAANREQVLARAVGAQADACRRDLQSARDQVAAQRRALALLGEPNTQVVALAPQPGQTSSGSVIFNSKGHQAMVMATALLASPGHDYELWVIRGKEKLAAGLIKLDPSGPTLAAIDERLLRGGVDVFAITLEPAGGGPVPRGSLVLVGAVKKG